MILNVQFLASAVLFSPALIVLASPLPREEVIPTLKYIHPNGDTALCLAVPISSQNYGFYPQSHDQLVVEPCTNDLRQQWSINKGDGKIKLYADQKYCLDANLNMRNGAIAQIFVCIDKQLEQQWWYTDDNRIAITKGEQCLDYDKTSKKPQTWKCGSGNTNQIWTTTGDPWQPAVLTDKDVRIHPNGNNSLCVTAQEYPRDGVILRIASCFSDDSYTNDFQHFELSRGDGIVRLKGTRNGFFGPTTNFCMDGGRDARNGALPILWTCDKAIKNQHWYYTDDNRIAITGGDQCLDWAAHDSNNNQTINWSFPTYGKLQTWKCGNNNYNQIFTTSKFTTSASAL